MRLNSTNIAIINRLLKGRNVKPLKRILERLQIADLASLMSTLDNRECRFLFDILLKIEKASLVIKELPEHRLKDLLEKLEFDDLKELIDQAKDEEATLFLSLVSDEERSLIFEILDQDRRNRLKQILEYPPKSAGHLMHHRVFSLSEKITAQEGIEQLRNQAQELSIHYIYCTNDEGKLTGVLSLRVLATAQVLTPIEKLMKKDVIYVTTDTIEKEVARLVSHYDLVALPVVDKEKQLIGVITVDDIIDIIQDQVTADFYAQAGLDTDDRVYSPAKKSIFDRMPWMILNLFLAALASIVVSFFEETMSQLIILASLKNIVAGVGGNTGVQTLTVVTRGLATGDFKFTTYKKALVKEMTAGTTVGLLIGLLAALLVLLWKQNLLVAIVICISMVINSVVAAFIGIFIPIGLKHFNRDPAIGSAVLVTVITDIIGFFSFLGIAALGLHFIPS